MQVLLMNLFRLHLKILPGVNQILLVSQTKMPWMGTVIVVRTLELS